MRLPKLIYRFAHLPRGSETHPFEGSPGQNAEPYFNLIQPRRMGRGIVEMNILVLGKSTIGLRLMGVKVAQDDMNFLIRIECNDSIHEEQKLSTPTTIKMSSFRQAYESG